MKFQEDKIAGNYCYRREDPEEAGRGRKKSEKGEEEERNAWLVDEERRRSSKNCIDRLALLECKSGAGSGGKGSHVGGKGVRKCDRHIGYADWRGNSYSGAWKQTRCKNHGGPMGGNRPIGSRLTFSQEIVACRRHM